MSLVNILLLSCIIIILIVFIVVIFLPETAPKKRKKEKPEAKLIDEKEWTEKLAALQRQVQALHRGIETHQRQEQVLEKGLVLEKAKVKKLEEKLSQERGWHEKEQLGLDKKAKDSEGVRKDLITAQDQLAKEHALTLRLEREQKELRAELDAINDQRRAAEVEAARFKAQMEDARQQAAQWKKDLMELKKKEADTSWVAKTEFEKLERQLKDKEKMIEQLRKEVK